MAELIPVTNYQDLVLLLLFLPIVSTLVGMFRHLVGVRTLSLYAPILLTYAFIALGLSTTSGSINVLFALLAGVSIYALVFIVTILLYTSLRRLRLHYFPKVSLVFTVLSILILAIVSLLFQLGVKEVVSLNVIAVVLVASISERMISTYARHGIKASVNISGETLLLAVLNFLLFSWGAFQTFLLASPWILIVVLVINLLVGRVTGLRLLEYFRFWEILNKEPDQD